MTTLTESSYAGEHIVSLANGTRSQEQITVLANAVLEAGEVVGKVASGKYVAWSPTADDGSEVVAGVLYDDVDATGADKAGVITARDAEVSGSMLKYPSGQLAAAQTGLAALGIIVR